MYSRNPVAEISIVTKITIIEDATLTIVNTFKRESFMLQTD